jgi:hypothetical protein
MKKNLLLIIFMVCPFISFYCQTVPNRDWVKNFSSVDSLYNAPTAIDVNGNVYVGGYTLSTSNSYDYVVIKYDINGNQLWSRNYNGVFNGTDQLTAMTLDPAGNVYVTGTSQISAAGSEYLTIKYDANGIQKWVAHYSGPSAGRNLATSIGADANGNIYVTGTGFQSVTTNFDIVTVKYNNLGVQQWVNTYNGSANQNDRANSIAVTNSGVFVTGSSADLIGGIDAATIKIDLNTGSQLWAKIYNGSFNGSDVGNAIVADAAGNIYITGSTSIAASNTDYLTIKYNSNGVQQWVSTHDGHGLGDASNALVLDNNNNIIVTGVSYTTGFGMEYQTVQYNNAGVQQWVAIFDIGQASDIRTNSNIVVDFTNDTYICGQKWNGTSFDWVVIRYSPGGNEQWSDTYFRSAQGSSRASGLAIDNQARLFVTGQTFNGSRYDITTIKYHQIPLYLPVDYNNEVATNSFLYYENKGQLVKTNSQPCPEIKYYTKHSYPDLYFSDSLLYYVFSKTHHNNLINDSLVRVEMRLLEAQNQTSVHPVGKAPDILNFYLPQCPKGITGVQGSQRLIVPSVYPNIDLHYYSNREGLKYYFVVMPGGDPNKIVLQFKGASSTQINGASDLVINTAIGNLALKKPTAYQVDLSMKVVKLGWNASWLNVGANSYKFKLPGSYNHNLPLVIMVDQGVDPNKVLHDGTNHEWETYLGGSGDDVGNAVSVDFDGNPYFTGQTGSSNFPVTTGPSTGSGKYDAFIGKFGAPDFNLGTGNDRKWVTYWGGSDDDIGLAIKSVGQGNGGFTYVAGSTKSTDIIPPSPNLGNYYHPYSGNMDGFILKVDNIRGTAKWLTFYGGTGSDEIRALAVDAFQNVYFVGSTTTSSYSSTNCAPPTDNLFPKCNSFSPFNNNGINGGGIDGFIGEFDNSGTLQWSSFFGGTGNEIINSIAVDANNNIAIVGQTSSSAGFPFPASSPTGAYNQTACGGCSASANDGFIATFSNAGSMTWSSYFGGSGDDVVNGVDYDASNNLFITGMTSSSTPACSTCYGQVPPNGQFPLCMLPNTGYPVPYFQNTYGGGAYDAFIAKFNNSGKIFWSTYYGGSDDDEATGIVCDNVSLTSGVANDLLITGSTYSDNLPKPNPAGSGINGGAGYYYNPNAAVKNWNITAFSDQFISMFSTAGNPFWGVSYGEEDRINGRVWPGHHGNDRMNAITSTKSVASNYQKQIYMVGWSDHQDHEVFANAALTNPPTPYQQAANASISSTTRDVAISSFSMIPHITSGIKEEIMNYGSLTIYPNPSTDVLNVQSTVKGRKVSIMVYDLVGKLIYSEFIPEGSQDIHRTIDISSWDNGVYIIQVISTEGSLSKRFIKSR